MLTLFTMPKPFEGHIEIIQRNAIQSWMHLHPACEVILLGDEKGTAEVAYEFGIRHIPEVARNEYGTPLLNSMFEVAVAAASHPLLCYINADIILLNDFSSAIKRIPVSYFLMVGQRWDLDITEPIDFNHPGWETDLRRQVAAHAVLHEVTGIDYFLFPRNLWDEIPPFALGRTAWDNWLIYRARAKGAAVIDATQAVTAIHQNHNYSHVAGGEVGAWFGPEAMENRRLAGSGDHPFTLMDANWFVNSQEVSRLRTIKHLRRAIDVWPVLYPKWAAPFRLIRRSFSVSKNLLRALRRCISPLFGKRS